jgi:small subunit ribosomal protein S2
MSKDNLVKELFENLVHIGHRTANWNPKMKPFIYGSKNKIHILDLEQTADALEKAQKMLGAVKLQNKKALFVGTKPHISLALQKIVADKHFTVDQKWQPGLLTNFKEIRRRIDYYLNLKKQFETGEINKYTKKEISKRKKELDKLEKMYHGVGEMRKLPAILVVLDAVENRLAIEEAFSAKIPVIAVVDSDGNPEKISLVIPGNDDSMKSIGFLLENLVKSLA